MPVSTRPIRDVLVERQIADEAAAFDIATVIGEVVDESQSELMTKSDGRAMIAEMREMFGKLDAKIDGLDTKLDAKIGGLDAKLDAKIDGLDAKLEVKTDGLDAKIDSLEVKIDAKIDALEARLEKRIAEQQARIYRFILLVGTAATTIISIVAAVT